MEFLTQFEAVKVRFFFMRLMYLSEVVFSGAEKGIKKEDASNTFVSAEFSRSFV
jgi:hypothetical protein